MNIHKPAVKTISTEGSRISSVNNLRFMLISCHVFPAAVRQLDRRNEADFGLPRSKWSNKPSTVSSSFSCSCCIWRKHTQNLGFLRCVLLAGRKAKVYITLVCSSLHLVKQSPRHEKPLAQRPGPPGLVSHAAGGFTAAFQVQHKRISREMTSAFPLDSLLKTEGNFKIQHNSTKM